MIDFGVAKAMEQPLTERTLFTHHGAIVGTLEYMSPEQAEGALEHRHAHRCVFAGGVALRADDRDALRSTGSRSNSRSAPRRCAALWRKNRRD